MQSSPFPCYFVPLKPKCLPQLPILEHPQPMLRLQFQRPRFRPTWNKRSNNSSGILECLYFSIAVEKTKDSGQYGRRHSVSTNLKFYKIFKTLKWGFNDHNIRTSIKPTWNILIVNCITNSCIWNTCVTWQGIDYKLPDDETIVSKRVGVW